MYGSELQGNGNYMQYEEWEPKHGLLAFLVQGMIWVVRVEKIGLERNTMFKI